MYEDDRMFEQPIDFPVHGILSKEIVMNEKGLIYLLYQYRVLPSAIVHTIVENIL